MSNVIINYHNYNNLAAKKIIYSELQYRKDSDSEWTAALSLLVTDGGTWIYYFSAIVFTNKENITCIQGYAKVPKHLGLLDPLNKLTP